jgi:hypothetical protein
MNSSTILHDAYKTLIGAACAIPLAQWQRDGVCGYWSVKDIVAHMASYEQVTVEVLTGFLRSAASPLVDLLAADGEHFNLGQVDARRHLSAQAILDEYAAAHATAQLLLDQIPPEMRQQNGTMPWYGNDYDLDDYLAYMYGHAREHAAQIDLFRTQVLSTEAQAPQTPALNAPGEARETKPARNVVIPR